MSDLPSDMRKYAECDLRRNVMVSSNLFLGINIYLDEGNVVLPRQAGRELFIDGSNSLAWSTPVGIDFDKYLG